MGAFCVMGIATFTCHRVSPLLGLGLGTAGGCSPCAVPRLWRGSGAAVSVLCARGGQEPCATTGHGTLVPQEWCFVLEANA